MRSVREFLRREDAAISVEWVVATVGLMVTGIWLGYTLFSGGLNTIAEENKKDFNRVKIQPDG